MSVMSARDRYLKSQKAVKGWLDPYSAQVIVDLGCSQEAQALAGAVGEIGVCWRQRHKAVTSSELDVRPRDQKDL